VIAVIDYKAGNLTSVMKALHAVGADAVATSDPNVVLQAEKLVLPGVGHFSATAFLDEQGLTNAIANRVQAGYPFLGICVGLQWLFEGSAEEPDAAGLGAFSGYCERFIDGMKVPHVGWNSIQVRESRLLHALIPRARRKWYRCSYRIRLAIHRGGRARQHHGRAIPSREVRARRPANP
jgi:imidazole glycerol-phosphate synthase subunit HisH